MAMDTPKRSLVTIEPFPSQKILGNRVGDRSLRIVMFFGAPVWGPKRDQKGPRALGDPDPDLDTQKFALGSNISKLRMEKKRRFNWWLL